MGHVRSGEPVDHHFEPALFQKLRQREDRLGDLWTVVFADDRGSLERPFHGRIKP
jgi:hypothetical protein